MIGQIAADSPMQRPSSGLRTWLIVVTVVGALGIAAAVPGFFFGTYMAAFAADDPSSTTEGVMNIMYGVWTACGIYVALLFVGIVGGWIAYRKRRTRLSFGLSLLAAVPVVLILLAIVALVVTNIVWTASL